MNAPTDSWPLLPFRYDDGGREAAGYADTDSDCVCRSVAIATQLPYQVVYDRINAIAKGERKGKRKRGISHAGKGVYVRTERKLMQELGWRWVPTVFIGKGCKIHLRANELPSGRLVVVVSRHTTAVIDGVIHDKHDPSRGGIRCVYGYYIKE